ncbi:MAG: D-2-hydroxyacid dehydrogenase [Pseudomonadota bacterium]
MLKILLSAQTAASLAVPIEQALGELGHQLVVAEEASAGDGIDIAFISREVTAGSTKHHALPATRQFYDLLTSAPNLSWVQIHSAGADRPIFGELRNHGVKITTASGANAVPVAHTALAGILALARNLPQAMADQRRSCWNQRLQSPAPRDLRGQTVMIVGWGPVAREVARLLQAVGLKCIAVRRERALPPEFGTRMVSFSEMPDQLGNIDWLVLACPLSETTRYLVNRNTLARMPRGSWIVNVARGEVARQSDLLDALNSGHLAGAYLDVTDPEPLPEDSPLWTMENVILTPHTAGHADTNAQAVAAIFLDNLARWRGGAPLLNLVA